MIDTKKMKHALDIAEGRLMLFQVMQQKGHSNIPPQDDVLAIIREAQKHLQEQSKFVVLEGLKKGNRLYAFNTFGGNNVRLGDGTIAYKVIGYADSSDEVMRILDSF